MCARDQVKKKQGQGVDSRLFDHGVEKKQNGIVVNLKKQHVSSVVELKRECEIES